jgi:hypothetical protein
MLAPIRFCPDELFACGSLFKCPQGSRYDLAQNQLLIQSLSTILWAKQWFAQIGEKQTNCNWEKMRINLPSIMSANRPDDEIRDDHDRHEEEVDEALEESFPASDPPNFTRGEREKG